MTAPAVEMARTRRRMSLEIPSGFGRAKELKKLARLALDWSQTEKWGREQRNDAVYSITFAFHACRLRCRWNWNRDPIPTPLADGCRYQRRQERGWGWRQQAMDAVAFALGGMREREIEDEQWYIEMQDSCSTLVLSSLFSKLFFICSFI